MAATASGGVPLDQQPQVIPVSYGGPYQEQFAAIIAEVAALSRLRAEIPVHFELPSAAEVAAMVSQIPIVGVTEPVHLAPTGGSVGVGPGPPPETAAAWSALSGAESEADAEAKLAASAETTAGDAAAGAVPKVDALCAAWETLGAAQKDAAAEGATAGQAAAAADEAAWQARIARSARITTRLRKPMRRRCTPLRILPLILLPRRPGSSSRYAWTGSARLLMPRPPRVAGSS